LKIEDEREWSSPGQKKCGGGSSSSSSKRSGEQEEDFGAFPSLLILRVYLAMRRLKKTLLPLSSGPKPPAAMKLANAWEVCNSQ
jgi:hypothetical protein